MRTALTYAAVALALLAVLPTGAAVALGVLAYIPLLK